MIKCAVDLNTFLRLSVNTREKDKAKTLFMMNTSVFKAEDLSLSALS